MSARDLAVPNFSRDYLLTFYSNGPTPDEHVVFDFLVRHYRKIGSPRPMIELGCGPAVHHVLPAVPFVSEIHMADYLDENLDCVRAWKNGRPGAHDWHAFTELTLTLEGRPTGEHDIGLREAELRKKITRLFHCDLTRDSLPEHVVPYPVVGCFYCTEVVGCTDVSAASKEEWRHVMRRVASFVAPGGRLFLSAVKESRFYALYSAGGTTRRLPVTVLTEQDFHDTLSAIGFDMGETVVESRSFTGQEAEGLHGVILVAARKLA